MVQTVAQTAVMVMYPVGFVHSPRNVRMKIKKMALVTEETGILMFPKKKIHPSSESFLKVLHHKISGSSGGF